MGTDGIIYIRTDGNSQIATGHIVRCLSIASACLSMGARVHFLVSDEESRELIFQFGKELPSFSLTVLKTALYRNMEQELPELLSLLQNAPKGSCLLVDSYFVTERYFSALHPVIRLAYMDDLQLFDYPVELVINYDVIPEKTLPAYEAAYTRASRKLLGSLYAPLRSQFRNRSITVRKQVAAVLITTGGSDPCHFSLRLVEHLLKTPLFSPASGQSSPALHIVIGRMNPDKEKLHLLTKELPFLTLHENVSDMASLMETCDLGVSAAGTTLYELCAMGLPSISFTMADNQLTAAAAFAQTGALPWAGDMRKQPQEVLQKVTDFLISLSCPSEKSDPSSYAAQLRETKGQRKTAHHAMRTLVDGKGAVRIAEALAEL